MLFRANALGTAPVPEGGGVELCFYFFIVPAVEIPVEEIPEVSYNIGIIVGVA